MKRGGSFVAGSVRAAAVPGQTATGLPIPPPKADPNGNRRERRAAKRKRRKPTP